MARTTAVDVDAVHFRYGRQPALSDVGFSIRKATICGLIGPNGAGKTTMLRIVATDLGPSSGQVLLFGRDAATDYASLRPRIGFMPDQPDLFQDLRLMHYLEMFAALYGLSGDDRKHAVDAAVELVGLEAFRERKLANLSKGEAQRVALARTLVHSPELLILDEPADGLDPRGRVELRELLLLLRERGSTILVSSHILADLEAICDDLVLLDRGRVVFAGSRTELKRQGLERERILIELAGSSDGRVGPILESFGDVRTVAHTSGCYEIEMPGGTDRAADLLAALIGAGVRVAGYNRQSVSLEDLFLRLTDAGAPRADRGDARKTP